MTTESRQVIPFAGCFATEPRAQKRARLVFVGLADDSQSSHRRGCAQGPARIRLAYDGNCYNPCTEAGVDLSGAVADAGDLTSQGSWELTARAFRECTAQLVAGGKIPFFAGGDHAVTVPAVAGLAERGERIHVIQIDAHPDLYPVYEGNPNSHACVAARLLEMSHVASVTQLGIRTLNPVQREHGKHFGDRIRLFFAYDLPGRLPALQHIPPDARVYLTVDLDGFDPAFAPGVAHPVPGGLTPRQVLDFIRAAPWKLVGMDVVELNPSLDVNNQTAILAARLLHEGMGLASGQS